MYHHFITSYHNVSWSYHHFSIVCVIIYHHSIIILAFCVIIYHHLIIMLSSCFIILASSHHHHLIFMLSWCFIIFSIILSWCYHIIYLFDMKMNTGSWWILNLDGVPGDPGLRLRSSAPVAGAPCQTSPMWTKRLLAASSSPGESSVWPGIFMVLQSNFIGIWSDSMWFHGIW